MTPLATVTGTSYTDTLTTSGDYYYAVVAEGSGLSTMSNSQSVTYTAPGGMTSGGIQGMSPFLIVPIIAIMIGPLSRRMRRGSSDKSAKTLFSTIFLSLFAFH